MQSQTILRTGAAPLLLIALAVGGAWASAGSLRAVDDPVLAKVTGGCFTQTASCANNSACIWDAVAGAYIYWKYQGGSTTTHLQPVGSGEGNCVKRTHHQFDSTCSNAGFPYLGFDWC